MSYAVKEIFRTLQGEGAHSGRPSVFCRFTGCNLWSGREEDRARASCRFCDTDFVGTDGVGGGRFPTSMDLAEAIERAWGDGKRHRNVVFTGGEPLLQLDAALVDAVHACGFECAIETNGTREAPVGVDWVCVSPKAGEPLRLVRGDEIKVVFPQPDVDLKKMADLDFRHYWISPMDGIDRIENTRAAIAYCLENPQWRLNLQSHKLIGIP